MCDKNKVFTWTPRGEGGECPPGANRCICPSDGWWEANRSWQRSEEVGHDYVLPFRNLINTACDCQFGHFCAKYMYGGLKFMLSPRGMGLYMCPMNPVTWICLSAVFLHEDFLCCYQCQTTELGRALQWLDILYYNAVGIVLLTKQFWACMWLCSTSSGQRCVWMCKLF